MAAKPKTKAALELERLQHEVRKTKAEAAYAELELAEKQRYETTQLANEGHHRIYHFIGQVNDKSVYDCQQQLARWCRRSPGQPVTVIFHSPGGGVYAGLGLFDFLVSLREQGHHLRTIVRGYAASMGAVLLQAGDERVIGPNSWFMIHEVSSGSIGRVSDQADDLEDTKRLNDHLAEILASRSTLSKTQIKKRTYKRDVWLSPEETVELGFADRVGS